MTRVADTSAQPIKLTRRKLEKLISGNPEVSAAAVELVYVTDSDPGILRVRKGKRFEYTARGKQIKGTEELARIRKLAIPPAWERVWISADPVGHLQATGIDGKGRKQYRYHPRWTAVRNTTKFHHLFAFGASLPSLRQKLAGDLKKSGLPKEKVLATVVSVMQETGIRIGNGAYEKLYGSFGLTTLKDKHFKESGNKSVFSFVGKKGISHNITLSDKRLAKIVQQCKDIPGQELFQYVDENGSYHAIDSGQVNGYIKEATGGDFSAKDFRTWKGTMHALEAFKKLGCSDIEKVTKARVLEMLDLVADRLGNTRAVCRKYYIHPLVVDLFCNGKLADFFTKAESIKKEQGLSVEESLLMRLLESAAQTAVIEA